MLVNNVNKYRYLPPIIETYFDPNYTTNFPPLWFFFNGIGKGKVFCDGIEENSTNSFIYNYTANEFVSGQPFQIGNLNSASSQTDIVLTTNITVTDFSFLMSIPNVVNTLNPLSDIIYLVPGFNYVVIALDNTIKVNGTNMESYSLSLQQYYVKGNTTNINLQYSSLPVKVYIEKQAYTWADLIQSTIAIISPILLAYHLLFGKSKLDTFGFLDYIFLKNYHRENITNSENILSTYYINTKMLSKIPKFEENFLPTLTPFYSEAPMETGFK